MKENIIQFGPNNNMIGISSIPKTVDATRPAVLILNSGLIHRVGPYRMAVNFARNLTKQGFIVFRFDLPDVGDSQKYKTSENYEQRTMNEISMAMDVISQRYKVDTFVSIGLCTGAMNSHLIAVKDKRVISAIMLDAYAYPTIKFLYKRYSNKLFKIFHPSLLIKVFNKVLRNKKSSDDFSEAEDVSYWEIPPKNSVKDDLKILMSRGTSLLYVYTGGSLLYYNYESQFEDSFNTVDFGDRLDVCFLDKTDHTFTLQRDREYLLSLMQEWVLRKFPLAAK